MASRSSDRYAADAAAAYDAATDDPPLIAVPGFSDSTRSTHWQRFIDNLDDAGYTGPVKAVTIDNSWGSPRDGADAVQDAVEETVDTYETPVNVVGHSMGGLTARWYVEKCDGAEYVDTLVTLGTPHRGSHNAWVVPYTGGGQAMMVGSTFLEKLNTDLSEDVDYTAIYSTTDEALRVPFWSPMIHDVERGQLPYTDAYDNAENVAVHGYGHFDLLTDDSVLDIYLDDLQTDE